MSWDAESIFASEGVHTEKADGTPVGKRSKQKYQGQTPAEDERYRRYWEGKGQGMSDYEYDYDSPGRDALIYGKGTPPSNGGGSSTAPKHYPSYNKKWLEPAPFEYHPTGFERVWGGRQLLHVADSERLVAETGVTHVLDLREPHEWRKPNYGEEAIARLAELGVERLNVPIKDVTAPKGADYAAALPWLMDAYQAGGKLYIHCRAGKERTAAMLMAFGLELYYVKDQKYTGFVKAWNTCCNEYKTFCPLESQVKSVYRFFEIKKWVPCSSCSKPLRFLDPAASARCQACEDKWKNKTYSTGYYDSSGHWHSYKDSNGQGKLPLNGSGSSGTGNTLKDLKDETRKQGLDLDATFVGVCGGCKCDLILYETGEKSDNLGDSFEGVCRCGTVSWGWALAGGVTIENLWYGRGDSKGPFKNGSAQWCGGISSKRGLAAWKKQTGKDLPKQLTSGEPEPQADTFPKCWRCKQPGPSPCADCQAALISETQKALGELEAHAPLMINGKSCCRECEEAKPTNSTSGLCFGCHAHYLAKVKGPKHHEKPREDEAKEFYFVYDANGKQIVCPACEIKGATHNASGLCRWCHSKREDWQKGDTTQPMMGFGGRELVACNGRKCQRMVPELQATSSKKEHGEFLCDWCEDDLLTELAAEAEASLQQQARQEFEGGPFLAENDTPDACTSCGNGLPQGNWNYCFTCEGEFLKALEAEG